MTIALSLFKSTMTCAEIKVFHDMKVPEENLAEALTTERIKTLVASSCKLSGHLIVNLDIYTNVGELVESLRKLEAEPHTQIIIYTMLETSDSEAPCGCYGYDSVCEAHRTQKEILSCGCTHDKVIVCSYHKY